MECKNTKHRLLDLLEATPEASEEQRLKDHVASCPTCRTELDVLSKGHRALLQAADRLAPHRPYLTQQTLSRLLAGVKPERRWPRIITIERVLVAAAAAAILVSAVSIARSLRARGEPAPTRGTDQAAAIYAPGPRPVQIALKLPPDQQRFDVVMRRVAAESPPAGMGWGAETWQAGVIRTSSPGVCVPVRNAFYDFEEAGYWW